MRLFSPNFGNNYMTHEENWGPVQVSSSPKKVTASYKVDDQGNMVAYEEHGNENGKSRLQRLQEERAKKLGLR